MMSRQRARTSSRPTSSKDWQGAQASLSATLGAFSTPFWVVPPSAILELASPTLLYTRVALEVYRSAGSVQGSFAYGIIVQAGDPDGDPLPTVFSDPAEDWQSDWVYRLIVPLAGSPPPDVHTNAGADTTIESHAKRKIPHGSGLLGVFQLDVANTVSVVTDTRVLLMNG